jgi:RNA polymerase sigma factor (sigma-70 family)
VLFRERPELLVPFREGDKSALEAVYRRYVRLVETVLREGTRVGMSRVFTNDLEAQKDLVQDVFARAFGVRARMGYDGIREYRPYLLTIARNVLVDWARKRKETLPGNIDVLSDAMVTQAEEPWADARTMRVVEAYLAGLPDDLRRLHALRYDEGLSQDETGKALGLTRQNVRTLEAKLRTGLSQALANQDRPKAVG